MNKNSWGSVLVVVICILLTQSIAFAFRGDNNFTLNYIASFTIGLQWIVFIHAGGFFGNERTEKFYDIVGSITFISTTIINSVFSKHYNMRTALLNTLVIIWTVRLGAFLFIRIHNNNGVDARFTELKQNNCRFLMTWTLQGVWVFMTLLPLLIMAQKENSIDFKVLDYLGCSLFIIGWLFETIADYQKLKFRSVPENKEKFINSGLWKYSRHPNYFGEILALIFSHRI
jgi:steroid 5-alpha reductase family enzyme